MILTGDFQTLSKDLDDNSIDMILTDPPWTNEFLPQWTDLGEMAARVLKPGRFLVAYSGKYHLYDNMMRLGEHLTYYWEIALELPGNRLMFWATKMYQAWRPILVFVKEPFDKCEKAYNGWKPDLIVSPQVSKKHHVWEQNVEPFRTLITQFSREGDTVLDPCLGGGTTAVACFLEKRKCIGYEIVSETADIAKERLLNTEEPFRFLTGRLF